ncbi:hypothetical protein ACO1O0_001580 [Amphichorda felina]
MSQPQAAAGPIDQKDIDHWMGKFNSSLADVNGTVNNQSSAGASAWSNNFWAFISPIDTCLVTWCCPCVTFGKTHHRLHKDANLEGYSPINTSCLMFCASTYFPLWCFPIAAQRADIRAKYNLEGSCVADLLCGWCCSCCSIVQMDKEVADREKLTGDRQGYQAQGGMSYPGK